MHTFTLACLGALEVMVGGHSVVHFPTDKVRALLVYLALEADRPHSRHALTGLLWPDQPQETAFANLRQTLRRLRQSLDEAQPGLADEVLVTTRQAIELRADALTVDVRSIDALMALCGHHDHADLTTCDLCLTRLAQVVALYRGDLLTDLSLPDAPPFEEWLVIRREMAQQQALTALHILAESHVQQGQYDQALAYATRQLALDPYREAAYRQAMRALASMGQRAAALAQYERCQSILRAELGVEPDAETTEVAEQIRLRRFRPRSEPSGADDTPAVHAMPLPAYVSPFVGREQTLTEMLTLIEQPGARLLTVVGAGGMGKTRLAVEVARASQDRYPDGVVFVPLAPVVTAKGIATALAAALGLSWRGSDPRQAVVQAVRHRQALLILDNFEHVVEGADLLVDLLEAGPDIQVIVTSRERLNIRGEHVYRVPGMEYSLRVGLADAAALPAVRLFVQTARRVRPDFELTEATVPHVLRICSLVQGMPLGLELAAAWAETLDVGDIAQEIEASADFLAYDWRDAPERQRSLRAVFEWSWGLLSAEEQLALARLSVFCGAFEREAAQQVAGVSRLTLTRLLHKSLLQPGDGQAGRYEMHNLLCQFAAERLTQLEPDGATADRHAHYFLRLLMSQERAMRGPQPLEAVAVVRLHATDLREAWFHAVDEGEWALIAEALHSLALFYRLDGWLTRGLEICNETAARLAHAAPDETDLPRRRLSALLTATQSFFMWRLTDLDGALTAARHARGEALALGDRYLEALATLDLAMAEMATMTQHVVADSVGAKVVENLERALAANHAWQPANAVERLRAAATEAEIIYHQGEYLNLRGEYDAAQTLCETALDICRRVGNRYMEGTISFIYAGVLESAGRLGQARRLREAALAFARDIGGPEREMTALNNMAGILTYLGDYATAADMAAAALHMADELRFRASFVSHTLSVALLHLGDYEGSLHASRRGMDVVSPEHMRSSIALWQLTEADALAGLERWLAADAVYAAALASGRELDSPSVVVTALAGRARVALAQGQTAAALAFADEALALLAGHQPTTVYEPLRAYLTCYEVLAAAADPRAAGLIERAHAILMEQAGWIDEPGWRRSFLENVAAHRDIQRAYAALHATTEARA